MVTYPNDWEEKSLLDCVSLVQGLTYTPENVRKYGTLVLRSSNIQNNKLTLEDNVYVNSPIPTEKYIQDNDILVCVRNGSSALIGKSCVLRAIPNTTFGAFMSVLRGDSNGYIAHLFESPVIQSQVRDRSSATINQITKKDFQSIRITVPQDEKEQSEIAAALSSFDTYIDNLTELIEKKKNIRDGALEDLVNGNINLRGFSNTWQNTTLGRISSYRKGKCFFPKRQYISTENMRQNFSGIVPYYETTPVWGCEFGAGDILLANIRPYLKKIWFSNFDGCCSADVLVLQANEGICSKLLYYILANERFVNYIMAVGIKGIKMPRGDKKIIMEYELKIPKDYEEQEAIAAALSEMDEEIANLESEKEKMIQIREGAMDDLLTGRVRLNVQKGDNQ